MSQEIRARVDKYTLSILAYGIINTQNIDIPVDVLVKG